MFTVLFFISAVYLYTVSNTIFGGDSGDLVSAILTGSFAHPPGYPFYSFLGTFFLKIPINMLSAAGKITFISTISSILSLIVFYALLKEIFQTRFKWYIACLTLGTLAFNYIIWLYSIVPEVFLLNVLITVSIFLCALKYKRTHKEVYLYLLALLSGLGLSHHHTFIFVLPPVWYLLHREVLQFSKNISTLLRTVVFFVFGILPLIYLPYASGKISKTIWGDATTVAGFLDVFLRKSYGTFVPGQFISNIVDHRFLQFKNLVLFIMNDFTLAGLILIVIGVAFLFKEIPEKRTHWSIVMLLILFGPFFFFYANFPVGAKFDFATLERFFIVFYFFLGIPLYIGILKTVESLTAFIDKIVYNRYLKRFTAVSIVIMFTFLPLGLLNKNSRVILALKNDQKAENLGRDLLANAQERSLIMLTSDTTLFNTQYIYYSEYDNADKIIIHTSKLPSLYYQNVIRKYYPEVKLPLVDGKLLLTNFIRENFGTYHIYANDKYPLQETNYEWVPQGLLFQLVKKDDSTDKKYYERIKNFWTNSRNKNLSHEFSNNPYIWKNYFTTDILRVYSIAHQNTAFYLMENDHELESLYHINEAKLLYPEDHDIEYLQSLYYSKINDCKKAEEIIITVLESKKDNLYYDHLGDIAEKCYQNESDKKRIGQKIKTYRDFQLKNLN